MYKVVSKIGSPDKGHMDHKLQARLAKFLWLELLLTIPLDTIYELITHFGIQLPLGQIIRSFFIVLNLIIIMEYGSRVEAQIAVLIVLFYSAMVLREVSLGLNAMIYAATYWAKFISFYLTFFAVKCSGNSKHINIEALNFFFRWSIRIVTTSFLLLALAGVLEQSTFDSGYEGSILSKNSMSAVLLLFMLLSLYYVFQGKLSFVWAVIVAITLFILGSKSTIVFCLTMIIACVIHEAGKTSLRNICLLGVLITSLCFGFWLFWDSLSSVFTTQMQRYEFVTIRQGESFIDYLLTGRNDLLQAGLTGYLTNFSPLFLILGGGISSLGDYVANLVNSSSAFRGIEMDFFEILLASGFIGLLVMICPFATAVSAVNKGRPTGSYYYLIGIVVQFVFMMLGGHVVTEGMPAEYLGIYLAYVCIVSNSGTKSEQTNYSIKS